MMSHNLDDIVESIKHERELSFVEVREGRVCVNVGEKWEALSKDDNDLDDVVIQRACSYEDFLFLAQENQLLADKYLLVDSIHRQFWLCDSEEEVHNVECDKATSFYGLIGSCSQDPLPECTCPPQPAFQTCEMAYNPSF
jgi:hypothetical protein